MNLTTSGRQLNVQRPSSAGETPLLCLTAGPSGAMYLITIQQKTTSEGGGTKHVVASRHVAGRAGEARPLVVITRVVRPMHTARGAAAVNAAYGRERQHLTLLTGVVSAAPDGLRILVEDIVSWRGRW